MSQVSGRLTVLRNSRLFDQIDPEKLTRIAHSCQAVCLRRGEYLFYRKDSLDSVYILVSGCLGYSIVSDEGRQIIVRRVLPYDSIGEVEAVNGATAGCDGMALVDSCLFRIPRGQFRHLLDEPEFARKLLKQVAAQLREVVDFAESVSLYSVETRLARLIVKLCDQVGRIVEDGILIDCPLSQGQLGQMINASRPKINLQIRRWHCHSFIRVEGNRMVVLEPSVMSELSRS